MDGCSGWEANHTTTAKRDSQPKNILKATNISVASEILSGLKLGREKKYTYSLLCRWFLSHLLLASSYGGVKPFFSSNLQGEPTAFRTLHTSCFQSVCWPFCPTSPFCYMSEEENSQMITKPKGAYSKWGKNLKHERKQWMKQAATKVKFSIMVNKELGISVLPRCKDKRCLENTFFTPCYCHSPNWGQNSSLYLLPPIVLLVKFILYQQGHSVAVQSSGMAGRLVSC